MYAVIIFGKTMFVAKTYATCRRWAERYFTRYRSRRRGGRIRRTITYTITRV